MKSLGRALGYLKPYWLLAMGTFVTLLLSTLLNLVIPALTRRIIDDGIDAKVASVIVVGALVMIGVALTAGVVLLPAGFLGGQSVAERCLRHAQYPV